MAKLPQEVIDEIYKRGKEDAYRPILAILTEYESGTCPNPTGALREIEKVVLDKNDKQ